MAHDPELGESWQDTMAHERDAATTPWRKINRAAGTFNVSVASSIGVWVIARHSFSAPFWLSVVIVVSLVPGWAASTWRGWRW